MDPTNPIYDSVTGGALRMARRHWYVMAVAAALGLAAGVFLSSGKATYQAEGTARILFDAVTPKVADSDEFRPTLDPVALASRVFESTDEADLPDATSFAITGDATAGSLMISVSGESEDSTGEAFDKVVATATEIATDEVTQSVRSRITALEQLAADGQARLDKLDGQLEDMSANGVTPAASNPVVLQRMAAADALATVNLDLAAARSQLDTLSTQLVTADDVEVEPSDSGLVLPVALMVLGALMAFGVLLVIQAVDGRLRRRIQIERDAPRTEMLGVVARKPSGAQLSVLGRTMSRFASAGGLGRVILVPLKGDVPEPLLAALQDSQDVVVEAADFEQASRAYGDDSVGIVFVVPFGAVPREQLQGAVADAATAGSGNLATVLVGVPEADHAWAAVSTM